MTQSAALFGVTRSALGRKWVLAPQDEALADVLMRNLSLEAIPARLLAARLGTEEKATAFMNPSLRDQLPDPSLFVDMDKAVARTCRAISEQEPMAVLGDYDVDGQTSISILTLYMRALGVPLAFVSPDRLSEGYGPNPTRMQAFAKDGAKLVFTVDCGTTAFDAISAANTAGLDVIVLDHHAPEDSLPAAHALINPNRRDETGAYGYMAAVGVTFMFIIALNRALRQAGYFTPTRPEPQLMDLLDIVALGTVADVVPLIGANRAMVIRGLDVMARKKNIGLAALIEAAALKSPILSATDIGFRLGPRINAGGRIGQCDLGAQLLTADNPDTARRLAAELERLNAERREIGDKIEQEAMASATDQIEAGAKSIVVADESWHPGVIGITAGRLKERFGVPTTVIGQHLGKWSGSGRSVEGVDLGAIVHEALHAGLLVKGGGHKMAAGLTIHPDRIADFRALKNDKVSTQIAELGGFAPYTCHLVATPEMLSLGTLENLSKLEPYGAGNPAPRLALQSVEIDFSRAVGADGNTVTCTLKSAAGASLKAIAFRAASEPHGKVLLDMRGRKVHIVGTVSVNEYQGLRSPQLIIEDVAIA